MASNQLPAIETVQDALDLFFLKNIPDEKLFVYSDLARQQTSGRRLDICSILNAKSGACPEDCSFCAQSAQSKTDAQVYPLVSREKIKKAAISARANGARRFCIVTSGRAISNSDLALIEDSIHDIAKAGLLPCATLGMMSKEDLKRLRSAGLNRYHHNLETSEAFFHEICSTHTYKQKVRTILDAKEVGLSVCSGGLFGLGESWKDRIEMAIALRKLGVDSVPINFLVPIAGTPLGGKSVIKPAEALRIIALYRLILPDKEIRVCGGRSMALKKSSSDIFRAGADGFLIGNYLTTPGCAPEDDLRMIKDIGFEIIP